MIRAHLSSHQYHSFKKLLAAERLSWTRQIVIDFGDFSLPLKNVPALDKQSVVATIRPENIQVSMSEKAGWIPMQL